jgi:hypothetical protein
MIYELLMMFSIVLGGAGAATLLRIESKWLSLAVGLVSITALRGISFTGLYAFGLQQFATAAFVVLSLGLFVLALVRTKTEVLRESWIPSILALIAVISTRVIHFQHTNHGDSKWILIASHVMSSSQSLSLLTGTGLFKRGFIVPQLLALGPANEFLSAIVPYIFMAMVSAGIYLLITLLKPYSKRTIILAVAPIMIVLGSTVMPWRSIYYLNGHTMMGTLIAVMTAISINVLRNQKLAQNEFIILVAASYVIAMVRPEGLLVGFIAMLPMLAKNFLTRKQLLAVLVAPAIALGVWLAEYNSYVIQATNKPWYLVVIALIVACSIPALPWLDWVRNHSVIIFAGLLTLILLGLEIVFYKSMQKGNQGLWANLVLTKGEWGYLFPFMLVLLIIAGVRKTPSEYWLLLKTSGLLVLSFLVAKTLDGGQVGRPDLGRTGWADSLNRMWIHILVILVVTVIVGIASRLEPAASQAKTRAVKQ